MRAGDFRYYSHFAYATKRYMGPGWALVGDAAAFLDPYYSPGLDHVGFSVEATTRLVLEDRAGRLTPVARYTPLYQRYASAVRLSRAYVRPDELDRAKQALAGVTAAKLRDAIGSARKR